MCGAVRCSDAASRPPRPQTRAGLTRLESHELHSTSIVRAAVEGGCAGKCGETAVVSTYVHGRWSFIHASREAHQLEGRKLRLDAPQRRPGVRLHGGALRVVGDQGQTMLDA
jgi:hypothetical protein